MVQAVVLFPRQLNLPDLRLASEGDPVLKLLCSDRLATAGKNQNDDECIEWQWASVRERKGIAERVRKREQRQGNCCEGDGAGSNTRS